MMPGCPTHDTQARTTSPAFYEERIRLLEEERDRYRDALEAIREKRCNGCKLPHKRWGPICSGVTVGDFTHYHSPEWWVARALGRTAA